MKNLVIIVHGSIQQDVADQLRALDRVQGFTFSHVEGHGAQSENDAFLSARDRVVGYVPRVRADILLQDEDVEGVLQALRTGIPGIRGRGVFWISDVDQYGPL